MFLKPKEGGKKKHRTKEINFCKMRHEDKENLFLYQKPGRYPSYLGRNREKKKRKKKS